MLRLLYIIVFFAVIWDITYSFIYKTIDTTNRLYFFWKNDAIPFPDGAVSFGVLTRFLVTRTRFESISSCVRSSRRNRRDGVCEHTWIKWDVYRENTEPSTTLIVLVPSWAIRSFSFLPKMSMNKVYSSSLPLRHYSCFAHSQCRLLRYNIGVRIHLHDSLHAS